MVVVVTWLRVCQTPSNKKSKKVKHIAISSGNGGFESKIEVSGICHASPVSVHGRPMPVVCWP